MPSITINGVQCSFEPGQTVLQVANANGVDIPYYCYHDGLSVPAQCRICLAEMWAPNQRAGGRLEPVAGGKLMPTCSTEASDGMVVRSDSPKSVANQKAVMEYLLINHPLDCPVCDQAGECYLQDYSYKYGRGVSRFQEQKVKQPKKDLGPHVYLYADRCIMCTRCGRFTREVSGTGELTIDGRGNRSEIDIFPGVALDNELSANVIDLCPVGALLDKDFLFTQRVWFLKTSPSIDGITSSGDNIWFEHNEGKVYRVKPRENLHINKYWITDEVRYGWKHIHSEDRLSSPMRREYGSLIECGYEAAATDAVEGLQNAVRKGGRVALLVSPMLTCEEAYQLAIMAREIDPHAVLGVGPVPVVGKDKVFPPGLKKNNPKAFVMRAEKAPNARGVRRVLKAVCQSGGGEVLEFNDFVEALRHNSEITAVVLTGNYPSDWATDDFVGALGDRFRVLIDTLPSAVLKGSSVVLPGATWAEKAGTFENATGTLQAFELAVPVQEGARAEGQIATDLMVLLGVVEANIDDIDIYSVIDEQPGFVPTARETRLKRTKLFNAANTRAEMADRYPALTIMLTDVQKPKVDSRHRPDMQVVEL
ncbi:MAG: (2Fe-2S)-binding protein [Phycisphaerales bacterium]|nr:(2Fe-2S)-binding protein [Phycisphaerales bacterium]